MRISTGILSVLTLGLFCGLAHAEKPLMSREDLLKTATNVVTGKVLTIYQQTEVERDWKRTKYVAEVRVENTEKGEGVTPGSLIYVRYWHQEWKGKGSPPPGTNGHVDIPSKNAAVRVYLARNSYDGFGFENKDGGFNVIGTNGFERLPSKPGK